MVILSGMSTMDQVIDNVKTFNECGPLSEEEQKTLSQAVSIFRKAVTVPCTGCRYCCDDCPSGIDIPKVLEAYNAYSLNKSPMALRGLAASDGPRPQGLRRLRFCANHCRRTSTSLRS